MREMHHQHPRTHSLFLSLSLPLFLPPPSVNLKIYKLYPAERGGAITIVIASSAPSYCLKSSRFASCDCRHLSVEFHSILPNCFHFISVVFRSTLFICFIRSSCTLIMRGEAGRGTHPHPVRTRSRPGIIASLLDSF